MTKEATGGDCGADYEKFASDLERVLDGFPVLWPEASTRPETRQGILDAAAQAVTVDRAANHGDAESSFATLAAVWSALLGAPVTAPQVALMLASLKIVRAWGNPGHPDNWVDLAGYAACGGEVAMGRGSEDG